MPPTQTPNQIAEQKVACEDCDCEHVDNLCCSHCCPCQECINERWENLENSEELTMANDIKALAHLEEISNNLDEIRKELSSVSYALLDIAKYLKEIAINTQSPA
jgi:3-methyladenine DNA glycosylase AlkC